MLSLFVRTKILDICANSVFPVKYYQNMMRLEYQFANITTSYWRERRKSLRLLPQGCVGSTLIRKEKHEDLENNFEGIVGFPDELIPEDDDE